MHERYASGGLRHFLVRHLLRLLAQTTRRGPWTWFFFGFFLAPVAGLVLLSKNSDELRAKEHSGA
jgi:hypothetical protein